MDICAPSPRRRCRVAKVASVFCISTDSVISNLQPAGRQAGRCERANHGGQQVFVHHLNRRQVDRDLDLVRPQRSVGTGFAQHPFSQRNDQADLFRDRDELTGQHHAALGMIPADQRFAAGDRVIVEPDNRLVIQLELAFDQALSQRQFERAPRLHSGIHCRLEEAVSAAAVRFCPVKSHVGVSQKFVGLRTVARRNRYPDARVHHGRMAVQGHMAR